uniref:histidine kinase n=1 Tax=Cyanothece sp. (strain PCC 7425 / ATCC 29141) TaxID=395961 RepID=B8HM45_CYAP4
MGLNAADLDAITQEARTCFLYEDAPEYLTTLEQGMNQIHAENQGNLHNTYTELMRAAHSLKGGAGIAQLSVLQQVSHRLEDLLEALQGQRIQNRADLDTAHELLSLGVEQIQFLVAQARQNPIQETDERSLQLMALLDQCLEQIPTPEVPTFLEGEPQSAVPIKIVQMALETDLEDCLQRIESNLTAPPASLTQALNGLAEECKLLGQTLSLPWLTELGGAIAPALSQPGFAIQEVATAVLEEIRQQRREFLQSLTPSPAPTAPTPQPTTPELGIAADLIAEVPLAADPIAADLIAEVPLTAPEVELPAAAPAVTPTQTPSAQPAPLLNLRIPVAKLDRLTNTVGELLINQERLSLYQSQFQQVSTTLKKRAEQFSPIKEQVQTFYDRLATPLAAIVANLVDTSPSGEKSTGSPEEFDALQFDRYTELHSTLLDFQELLARIQEVGADIDLLNRDLQDGLDQLRQQLNGLRSELTDSRLLPFRFLAEKFIPALQTLNRRYGKQVELDIMGGDTLIDQVVIEQLKTPLTHLFRNAFDHGIESPPERQQANKPQVAKIRLGARVLGNQVMVTIADDGRGIDLEKVAQRAVQMGLGKALQLERLSRDQLLQLIFTPGFSTATGVTDLSGRGVGLDVVKREVENLRGTVRVETMLGLGTQFTLSIPLTLSILPLLLCQCRDVVLSIPSVNVLEVINLRDYCNLEQSPQQITWKDQTIPLRDLLQLLPYQRSVSSQAASLGKVGLVVEANGQPLALAVDTLLEERELVIKPFDATVKIPPYLIGCSVLGTGQVIPVLAPTHFDQLLRQTAAPSAPVPTTVSESLTETILIVDDSIAVRRLLERVLTQGGYQVTACRDGKEALEELNRSQGNIAMVISDIEMPRLDGYGLLKEIRTHPRWHRLPVAMLTSRSSDSHRQKAMDLGATTYFTKPFQATELLATLDALLH